MKKEKDYESITFKTATQEVTLTADQFDKGVSNGLYFHIPPDDDFLDSAFTEDVRLDDIGGEIIAEYDDFSEIAAAKVLYLWKQKGGKKGGHTTLGKCQKPSGLLMHYARADFVVWLAADHCRTLGFNAHQIKALIFHELKHADYDPKTGEYTTRGHDFEGFGREIEEFGLWDSSARQMAKAFKTVDQPDLFVKT